MVFGDLLHGAGLGPVFRDLGDVLLGSNHRCLAHPLALAWRPYTCFSSRACLLPAASGAAGRADALLVRGVPGPGGEGPLALRHAAVVAGLESAQFWAALVGRPCLAGPGSLAGNGSLADGHLDAGRGLEESCIVAAVAAPMAEVQGPSSTLEAGTVCAGVVLAEPREVEGAAGCCKKKSQRSESKRK